MRKSGWLVIFVALGGMPAAAEDATMENTATVISPVQTAAVPPMMPSYQWPTVQWRNLDEAMDDLFPPDQVSASAECRDRLHKAGVANETPPSSTLEIEEPEALMLWAVDKRIDGCSVMVVKDNPDDVRPIPDIAPRSGLTQIPVTVQD